MLMKRIQAPTLQDAMAKTRAECGDNALVIDTQATASGYVVIAARPDAVGSAPYDPSDTDWTSPRSRDPDDASIKRFATGFRALAARARTFGIRDTILDAVDSALRGTRLRLDIAGDPAVPTVAVRVLAALLPTTGSGMPEGSTTELAASRESDSQVSGSQASGSRSSRPQITALVGPTGVGKTTTLAKLAAGARQVGETVAILTIDTYRVSAAEHLRAYADMLGVPFEVALDANELARAVARHEQVDRIFIDTSGRSPFDRAAIELLRARLSTARPTCALCLPAAARHRDALSALRGFAPVGADQLIVTKWDETSMPGEVLSVAAEHELPLANVTIGQEVPDDILPAQATALARCAFGLASTLASATERPRPNEPRPNEPRPNGPAPDPSPTLPAPPQPSTFRPAAPPPALPLEASFNDAFGLTTHTARTTR